MAEPALERGHGDLAAVVGSGEHLGDLGAGVQELTPGQRVAKLGDEGLGDVLGVRADAKQAHVQVRVVLGGDAGVAPPHVVVGGEAAAEVAGIPDEGDGLGRAVEQGQGVGVGAAAEADLEHVGELVARAEPGVHDPGAFLAGVAHEVVVDARASQDRVLAHGEQAQLLAAEEHVLDLGRVGDVGGMGAVMAHLPGGDVDLDEVLAVGEQALEAIGMVNVAQDGLHGDAAAVEAFEIRHVGEGRAQRQRADQVVARGDEGLHAREVADGLGPREPRGVVGPGAVAVVDGVAIGPDVEAVDVVGFVDHGVLVIGTGLEGAGGRVVRLLDVEGPPGVGVVLEAATQHLGIPGVGVAALQVVDDDLRAGGRHERTLEHDAGGVARVARHELLGAVEPRDVGGAGTSGDVIHDPAALGLDAVRGGGAVIQARALEGGVGLERDGDERVEAQQHVVIGGGAGHCGGVLAVGPMPVGEVQRLERAAAVEQVVQAGGVAAHDGGVVVGAVEVGQRGVVLEPAVHGGRTQLEAGDAVEHGVGVHALVLDVGEGDFPRKRGDARDAEPARKGGDLAVGVGVGLAGLGLVKAHGQDLAAGVVVPPGVVIVLETTAQHVGPDVDGALAVTHAMGVGGVAVALHEVGRGAVPRIGGVGRVLGLVDDAQPRAVRRAARVGGGKVVETRIPQGHGAVEDQRLERLAAGEHVGAVHGVDGAHLPVVDVHDVEALATLEHVGEARDVAHGPVGDVAHDLELGVALEEALEAGGARHVHTVGVAAATAVEVGEVLVSGEPVGEVDRLDAALHDHVGDEVVAVTRAGAREDLGPRGVEVVLVHLAVTVHVVDADVEVGARVLGVVPGDGPVGVVVLETTADGVARPLVVGGRAERIVHAVDLERDGVAANRIQNGEVADVAEPGVVGAIPGTQGRLARGDGVEARAHEHGLVAHAQAVEAREAREHVGARAGTCGVPPRNVEVGGALGVLEHVGEIDRTVDVPVRKGGEVAESLAVLEHGLEGRHLGDIPGARGSVGAHSGDGLEVRAATEHERHAGDVTRGPVIDGGDLSERAHAVEHRGEARHVGEVKARAVEARQGRVAVGRREQAGQAAGAQVDVGHVGLAALGHEGRHAGKAGLRGGVAVDAVDGADPRSRGMGERVVGAVGIVGAERERARTGAGRALSALLELPPEVIVGIAGLLDAAAVLARTPGVGDVVGAQVDARAVAGQRVAVHEVGRGAEPGEVSHARGGVGGLVGLPGAEGVAARQARVVGQAQARAVEAGAVAQHQRGETVEAVQHVGAVGGRGHLPIGDVQGGEAHAVLEHPLEARDAGVELPAVQALEVGDVGVVGEHVREVGHVADAVVPVLETAHDGEAVAIEQVAQVGGVAGIPAADAVDAGQVRVVLEHALKRAGVGYVHVAHEGVGEVDVVLEPELGVVHRDGVAELDRLDHSARGVLVGLRCAATQDREPRELVEGLGDHVAQAGVVHADDEELVGLVELPPHVHVAGEDVAQQLGVEEVGGGTGTDDGGVGALGASARVAGHEVRGRAHELVARMALALPRAVIGGVATEGGEVGAREVDVGAEHEALERGAAVEHVGAIGSRGRAHVPAGDVDGGDGRAAHEHLGEVGAELGVQARAVKGAQVGVAHEPVVQVERGSLALGLDGRDLVLGEELRPGQVALGGDVPVDLEVGDLVGLEGVGAHGERLGVGARDDLPPGVVVIEATATIRSVEDVGGLAVDAELGGVGVVARHQVERGAEPRIRGRGVGALPHAVVVAATIEGIEAGAVRGVHEEHDAVARLDGEQRRAAVEHVADVEADAIGVGEHVPTREVHGGERRATVEEAGVVDHGDVDAIGRVHHEALAHEGGEVGVAGEEVGDARVAADVEAHGARGVVVHVAEGEVDGLDLALGDGGQPRHGGVGHDAVEARGRVGVDGDGLRGSVVIPMHLRVGEEGALGMEGVDDGVGELAARGGNATGQAIAGHELRAVAGPVDGLAGATALRLPDAQGVELARDGVEPGAHQRGVGAQAQALERGHAREHVGAGLVDRGARGVGGVDIGDVQRLQRGAAGEHLGEVGAPGG